MTSRVAVLPGDGIGPEVTAAAVAVMREGLSRAGVAVTFHEALIGGAAMDQGLGPLPAETLGLCRQSAGVLLGAVGGPAWAAAAGERPEDGLLSLRAELGLFANLRPARHRPGISTSLRDDAIAGADLLLVRELSGSLYYGPRGRAGATGQVRAFDTMCYRREEVERVAHVAFNAAAGRRGLVTSVDKANVLECSRLWRRVVDGVAGEHRGIRLEHRLIDSAILDLVRRPADFDVVLAENMMGDILSDASAALTGSLGLLPSASLGAAGPSLFEPVHGSAPDLAGRGVANPIGAILSGALLLRHALGLEEVAAAIEASVELVLAAGTRTPDLGGNRTGVEVTDHVLRELDHIMNREKAVVLN
ncbi:MAG: 3-isopropylmalate dehydrogenase [Candidatus Dormibacteria bacterium]